MLYGARQDAVEVEQLHLENGSAVHVLHVDELKQVVQRLLSCRPS